MVIKNFRKATLTRSVKQYKTQDSKTFKIKQEARQPLLFDGLIIAFLIEKNVS